MPRTWFLTILCSCLALTFSACLETETTTVVHPDGRLTRTMVFSGDSAQIVERNFSLPLDSTWAVTVEQRPSSKATLRATQTFSDADAMNRASVGARGKTVTVSASFERRFRWFVTAFQYTETWHCYRLIEAVPLAHYISAHELDLIYTHALRKEPIRSPQDSVLLNSIETKYDDWHARNLFEAHYREFLRGVDMLHSPNLTSESVEKEKKRLYAQVSTQLLNQTIDIPQAQKLFTDVLKSKEVAAAFQANAAGFDSLKVLLEFEGAGLGKGFKAAVTMPGLIVSTNAEGIEGNTARWEDAFTLQYLRDIELQVESRVVNWWAIVVTGAIVALLLVYLVIALLRRR